MRQKSATILVVDDDKGHLTTLKTVLKSWGFEADAADDGTLAVEKVQERPYDLILMDVRMAVMSGIEALRQIQAYNPSIPILIMTAYSSVESAVEAMKAGAYDYLTKPLDFDDLKLTMERALEHTRLKEENMALKEKLNSGGRLKNIIGKSPAMKELVDMVALVAPSEATILITGESGTGKELVARAIHANSSRKDGPLVIVNCAALAETLLESELFGHEKGAFTGADKRREGRFAHANKGTIFLDEIGEMSLTMQAKLLRVIQDRKIQRVGSDQSIGVDVRIVAATNRRLEEAVSKGTFREDLYYRLNVVTLHVPPLRDRIDDIPRLAKHFLDRYAERNQKPLKGFDPRAMDMLLKYTWPGNVRELENAVERAVILVPGDYITPKELPLSITEAYPLKDELPQVTPAAPDANGLSLEALEKQAILNTLAAEDGNKSEAARKLGITRRTLYKKLEKYGMLN
ncbi:MAG: sigma-54 dependent transcriptional regulator [Deltaproteobacteria bacterium]